MTIRQNGKEECFSSELYFYRLEHLCNHISKPDQGGLKKKKMGIQTFITEWVAASNAFDTGKYLSYYLPDAVLDDRSVGRKFEGHKGIQHYFDSYFISYNIHTEQLELKIIDQQNAHLEVQFTGNFPEGKIGGTFQFRFENDKIASVKADLLY